MPTTATARLLTRAADLIAQARAESEGIPTSLLPDVEAGLREYVRDLSPAADLPDLADLPPLDDDVFAVPADSCLACRGTGYRSEYGQAPCACWACGGRATAGVYVVQIVSGTDGYEMNGESTCFADAVRTAERAAGLSGRLIRRARVDSARVVYRGARTRRTVGEVRVKGSEEAR